MIYVTTGNQRFPFTRLLLSMNSAIAEGLIQDEVYVQYGSFRPEFKLDQFTEKRPVYPYEEHIELIRHADLIVSDAGEDIVLLCLMLNKKPIIIPRQKNYCEQVDNHQVEFAAKMNDLKKAVAVYQVDDLISSICNYQELTTVLISDSNSESTNFYPSHLTNELSMLLQTFINNSTNVKENWEIAQ